MKKLSLSWLDGFTELFYPITCEVCGDLLVNSEYGICSFCTQHLPYSPWKFGAENPIVKSLWGRCSISSGFHLLAYRKTSMAQRVVHSIKYKNQQNLALLMGRRMGSSILESESSKNIDGIVPIPMHPKKLKQRGYNQSELIALGIADVLQQPLYSDFLIQGRYTSTQTFRGRLGREENAGYKYQMNVNFLHAENKHILLVDDVMTTGSTLEAAESTIRMHFTAENLGLSIATLAYVF